MLTKLIVAAFQGFIEVALWIFLLVAFVAGWKAGDGMLGGIAGLVIGLVFEVIFFGAVLILQDIRLSVRAIQANQNTGNKMT